MVWRRRRSSRNPTPRNPFDEAYEAINKLEYAVVATIAPAFTLEDIPRAFWTDDVVDKLTTAFPLTNSMVRRAYHSELATPLFDCYVMVRIDEAKMLCPEDCTAKLRDTDSGKKILDTLSQIYDTVVTFNKVRTMVDWMNKKDHHFTLGAAKHFCPWITSLLPENHGIHKVDGVKFNIPRAAIPADAMREVGAIVAMGNLAPPMTSNGVDRADFTVRFNLSSSFSNTFAVLR